MQELTAEKELARAAENATTITTQIETPVTIPAFADKVFQVMENGSYAIVMMFIIGVWLGKERINKILDRHLETQTKLVELANKTAEKLNIDSNLHNTTHNKLDHLINSQSDVKHQLEELRRQKPTNTRNQ